MSSRHGAGFEAAMAGAQHKRALDQLCGLWQLRLQLAAERDRGIDTACRAAGIRARGDGRTNTRYTGGFRRWPYNEGDGGRASSGRAQNSKKNACVWHMPEK